MLRHLRKIFNILICWLFYLNISVSQSKTIHDDSIKTKVDFIAAKYLSDTNNAGIVFGIIKDSSSNPMIFTYGYSDKNRKIKTDSHSLFQIGSITKVFTATLLTKFVKDGKMKLTDPVQKYLPEHVRMPVFSGVEITLEELAEHTSGLPRMPSNFIYAMKDMNNPYQYYDTSYLFNFLDSFKLKYEPGKHWEYSNLSFGLLGEVLSLTSKKSYEELVVQYICNTLEMNDTRMKLNEEQSLRKVQGYSKAGIPTAEWTFTNCMAGGGALFSTVSDMMKWLKYNMGITKNEISGLPEITEKEYWSDTSQVKFSMGLGWQIDSLKKNIIRYNKNGGAGGCVSIISFTKEPATGVVILSNSWKDVTQLGFELTNYLLSSP